MTTTSDFIIAIYNGIVLPERGKPARYATWRRWVRENEGFYTQGQFDQVAERLRSGKSWVILGSSQESHITLACLTWYNPGHTHVWETDRSGLIDRCVVEGCREERA